MDLNEEFVVLVVHATEFCSLVKKKRNEEL